MLLTIQKPAKSDFDFKHPHDYSPPISYSSRFSPKVTGGSLRPLSSSVRRDSPGAMSTSHRGLPPPAGMTLPDPGRGPPPPMPPQSLGSMPAPPPQWQATDDSMKNWLNAKAEEEKRKQEEEKTKQERLKLEQRQIEQSMLRESVQGGIPPQLVPVIFAGIGGGNLANLSMDWVQQYMAQIQGTVQQQPQLSGPHMSPDGRREQPRLLNPPPQGAPYGIPAQPSAVLQGQSAPAVPPHNTFPASSYASGGQSPQSRPRASTISGGQTGTLQRGPPSQHALPRLSNNELQVQPPPQAVGPTIHSLHHQHPPPLPPQQQSQQPQEQQQSSPSIYFHHWVPPTSQPSASARDPPATPSDHTSSPKKRKAQGAHERVPPPTSVPQYTSPPFSQASSSTSTPARRGHTRARSDLGHELAHESGRPSSRHGGRPPYSYETERHESRVERYDDRPPPRRASVSREGLRSSRTSTPASQYRPPPPPPPLTRSPKREDSR